MLLHESRSDSRTDDNGELILLDQQDRSRWRSRDIQKGLALLDKALHLRQAPGRYQLEASIAALHAEATDAARTDWPQIALLYRKLIDMDYSAVLHLNYAVAVAMTGSVTQAMAELDVLADRLSDYFPFYCVRADLHQRLGNPDACCRDFETALTLTDNEAERRFIQGRLEEQATQTP